jgi:high affinity cGMP-specific 3',5'-cyclic phosphodiesterase 9
LRDLREEIELLRVDIDLLIRSVGEVNPEIMEDPVLSKVSKSTPDEALLEKMLSLPFQVTLTNHETGERETKSVVLADQKPFRWKELLIPNINLNSYTATEKMKLTTLEFNLFPYKDVEPERAQQAENHLFGLVIHMFHELGLIKEFRIPETTLWRFVYACSRRYRAVPFHSFFHAFNVTQTLFHFLTGCGAAKAFGPLELLGMVIATMCHDMDHPGLNNDFQRKAHTRIAQLHKKSILENHHYLQAMGILSKAEFNILVNLTPEQEDLVLLYVRDLILATDLSMHGLVINKLKERQKVVSRLLQKQNCHLLLDQEDKILLMCSLVKCADLSNEIREQSLAKQWAKLVLVEFFKQADTEKELKLETAAFMDRTKIIISKEQLNFIEKLCMPLYTATVAIFPKMDKCIKQMQSNRDEWDRLLNSFFVDKSTLSNQSIWEGDKKEKTPEGQNLSTTLASRASNSLKPSTKKPK